MLQILTHFILQSKKKITLFCCVISQLISSDSLSIEDQSNSSSRLRFSKILFFAWKLKYCHQKLNTVSCFSWSGRLTSFIFKKISPEYPCLRNSHFCISLLLNKNDVPWKKRHKCLSSRHFLVLSSPSIWRRLGFKGQDLICFVLFSSSVMSDSVTTLTAACQASLSFAVSWSLLKLISI